MTTTNNNNTLEVRVVDITPELARQMLARLAPYQRRIMGAHVAGIESDLRAGRWVPNGSPIRFDTDGMLTDGQHRLTACVRTGITLLQTVVIGNLPPEANATIDTNARPRSSLQIARLQHHDVAPTTSTIAAAGIEHYNFQSEHYVRRSTPTERVEIWNHLPEEHQRALKRLEWAARTTRVTSRCALAAALRCLRTDPIALDFFVLAFTNDAHQCPAQGRVLHNALVRMRAHRSATTEEEVIAWMCLRAFVAFMRDERLQVLRPPHEWPHEARTLHALGYRPQHRSRVLDGIDLGAEDEPTTVGSYGH